MTQKTQIHVNTLNRVYEDYNNALHAGNAHEVVVNRNLWYCLLDELKNTMRLEEHDQ